MARYTVIECDGCGKTKRSDNPYTKEDYPEEFVDVQKANEGWIETNSQMYGGNGKMLLFSGTFCSLKCLREHMISKNFKSAKEV